MVRNKVEALLLQCFLTALEKSLSSTTGAMIQ